MAPIDLTSTVTTTAHRLATALAATLPFTGRDWMLPGIRAVQLHATGGTLTAVATDRYSVGHARVHAAGTLPRPFCVDRGNVENLLDALRQVLAEHDDARVTIYPDSSNAAPHLTFTIAGISINVPEAAGANNYPSLDDVMAQAGTRETAQLAGPVGLSARTLRALAAALDVMGADDPMSQDLRWYFNGAKAPVRVEVGDWFVAALMPVRLRGDEPNVPFGLPNTNKNEA